MISIRKPRYLRDIQDDMTRMLEETLEDFGITGARLSGKEKAWRPAIELYEQNGNYQLKAELPGIHKEDIDVEIGEDMITVKAEMKKEQEEKKGNVCESELRYGKFIRNIAMPTGIDNSQATADFKNGILTITVPKSQHEQEKMKKLEIKD